MIDIPCYYETLEPMYSYPVTKPNIRTGEGRMKLRGRDKHKDQKKKIHRKMAKKSRKTNRK